MSFNSRSPGKSTSVRVRRASYRQIVAVADELFVPIATAIDIVVEGWRRLDDDQRRDAWRAVRERRCGNGEPDDVCDASIENGACDATDP